MEMENLPFEVEDARAKSLPLIGERIWYLQWKRDVRNHSFTSEVYKEGVNGVFYRDIPAHEREDEAKFSSLLKRYKKAAKDLKTALAKENPTASMEDLENQTMTTPVEVGRHPWEGVPK